MPGERSKWQGGVKFRRAHPSYLLLITFLAVGSWWLLAVSQTPLGGQCEPAPAKPDAAAADASASALALRAEYEKAQDAVFSARTAVEAAHRAVASAQHDWEECLAARAASESLDAARRRDPAPVKRLPSINPQYTEALASRQRLLTQLEVLLQRYTREHPDVVAISSHLAALDDEMKKIPEFVVDVQSAAAASDRPPLGSADAAGPSLSGAELGAAPAGAPGGVASNDSALSPGSPTARPFCSADPAAADAIQELWDRAQEELQRSIRAEQQAVDRADELRRLGATEALAVDAPQPLPADGASPASEPSVAAVAPSQWSLAAAFAVLLGLEMVALRLACTVLALERSAPLTTIDAVVALLPMPLLATLPTSLNVGQSTPDSRESDASWLVFWLLACEGTLAAMAFLLVALTVRSADFPLEFLRHPIHALGAGLRDLH